MDQARAYGRSPRRRWQVTSLLSAAALVLAACGADENGDEVDVGDNGDDEAGADGDPEASTLTVDGEDVELYFTECLGQFEHDGVEISARGFDPFNPDHDPELQLHLSVDEDPQDEGVGRGLRLRRAPVEPADEFDGHEWEPVEGSEPTDIDWTGTSAEREFEISDVGEDEPDGEQGDVVDVTYDLAC